MIDNGSSREGAAQALEDFLVGRYQKDLLVVDDDALARIGERKASLPYVTYVRSNHNDGYACGNNKGLKVVDGDEEIDTVLILNNDVLFVEDIIPGLREALYSKADAAIISPILYKRGMSDIDYNCARRDTTIWKDINKLLFHYFYALFGFVPYKDVFILKDKGVDMSCPLIPIELPSGSCMMMRKCVMNAIGRFDTRTFLYYEENILYRKIKRIGLQSYLSTKQRCIHLGGESTSQSPSMKMVDIGYASMRTYYDHHYLCKSWERRALRLAQKVDRMFIVLQKKVMNKPLK